MRRPQQGMYRRDGERGGGGEKESREQWEK
jgi:hypothetical protein